MTSQDETKDFGERTLSNAERLYDDAQILIENGRGLSANLLAILAIEELGKFLILRWGVTNKGSKNKFPTHIEKQSAVFALLSSNELLKKNRKKLRKMLKKEANFLTIGEFSHQFAWARSGFYEDIRKSATYADENPKIPNEVRNMLSADLATVLLNYFDLCLKCSNNEIAMKLAAHFYEHNLARL